MKRTLKIIVAAALAVLALSAVASAAGAAAPKLKTPGHSGATIKGEQFGKHIFSFGGLRELECEVATFSGTLSGESNATLGLTPTYEKCKTKPILGISFPATVHMNGCSYLFHGEENTTEEALGKFLANVDLVCGAGQEVVVNVEGAANCTVKVPPFTGHKSNTNTNRGTSPQTVESSANVQETANGSGGICGSTGQTTTYTGKTILKAEVSGVQVALEAVKG